MKTHVCDFSDKVEFAKLVNSTEFHVVLHLGAMSAPGVCEKSPLDAMRVNCPENMIDALKEWNVVDKILFIFASTDMIYKGISVSGGADN